MFETPFFTSPRSSLDEDSFDTDFSSFGQNNFYIRQNSASFLIRNALPPKQPVITGEDRSSRSFEVVQEIDNVYDHDEDSNDQAPPVTLKDQISPNQLIPISSSQPYVQDPDSDPEYPSYEYRPHEQTYFPGTAVDVYHNGFSFNEFSQESIINVESNVLNVQETVYDTTAHIESNYLNIEEEVVHTTANIVSNFLDVEETMVETTASIVSNQLEVQESTIETPVTLESNRVQINEVVISSSANVESNEIQINEITTSVPVNIEHNNIRVDKKEIVTPVELESNQILISRKTLDSTAVVESNKVQVVEKTIETNANIVSNDLSISERVIDTPVNLESNKVQLLESTINSVANIESNKVLVNEVTKETPVCLERNNISVFTKCVNTPVSTESNKIQVSNNTINTPVFTESNKINIVNNTINTPVSTESNKICIVNKTINTPVSTESNKINVFNNTINTPVSTESNKILLSENVIDVPVYTVSNDISVNSSTIETPVHIASNNLIVNEETLDTVANVLSNNISVYENTIDTPVHIENNNIQVHEQIFNTPVELESNRVQVHNHTINTPAHITSNNLTVDEKVVNTNVNLVSNDLTINSKNIPTQANIVSNSLQIDHKTIPSTATIESLKLNVVEEVHESNVIVPKFVFNFVEKETPINVSLSGLFSQLLDHKSSSDLKSDIKTDQISQTSTVIDSPIPSITNKPLSLPSLFPPTLSLSAPFYYSFGDSENVKGIEKGTSKHRSLAISDSSEIEGTLEFSDMPSTDDHSDAPNNSSGSAAGRSSDSDPASDNNSPHDDRTPPDLSSSSDSEDSSLFTPEMLKRDLSNVDNKFDLNNVRSKWNGKLVNVRLFGSENDVIDNPIMWNVAISGEWPAVGHFVCPECLNHAEDVNINIRNHVDRVHHTNPIETCHNAVVAKIIGRSHIWKLEKEGNEDTIIESVYTCTVEGCNYFTNCRRNYLSHLRSHKQLQDLVAKFGFFWGPIIHGAKCGRMIKASDIFRDREGYGCPYCDNYFTSSSCGFTQHMSKLHPQHRVEGAHPPDPIRIKLKTLISQEIVDDELSQLRRNRTNSHLTPHSESVNDSVTSQIDNASPNQSQVSDSTPDVLSIPANAEASNVQSAEVAERSYHESIDDDVTYDKDELLRKASKWLRKCDEEEENGVSLPRLKLRQRKRVFEPLRNLFETKITKLIKYIKFQDCDDDDWFITEGILARISLLVRKCIRTSLRIPINNTKKKKVRNRDLEYNRSSLAVKKIFELTELCDLLEKLHDIKDARNTASQRNSIANLEKRIVDCIKQSEDGIVNHLFGGKTLEHVRRFLNDSVEHCDSKINWLRSRIIKEEELYKTLRGRRYQSTIREFYNEDARRCADWFIYGSVSPECKVPLDTFENHFRNEWRRSEDYNRDSPLFSLDPTVDEESQRWMLEKLTDTELIERVIRSKSNMSAAGPDAISNVVWKSNAAITSKLISRLIKAMLATGKTPSAWKRSRTIMLFKKGADDDVKSWRPISLTPTLYRIVMGHVANVVQTLNSRSHIFCHAQKGFTANVNGCSEHIGVLNELISHATRHKNDINILTLDFANAFGSVDHRQIVDSLLAFGFPTSFCNMIKDLYRDNTTCISVSGEYSSKIPMERGVRQGCPFSPILFNVCLEPLLREIILNHEADGYKVDDTSFNVQAFADDVVLISHSAEQMKHMLDAVASFCSVTGMKLTGSKCKWLSYLFRDGRRVSSADTLYINGDEIKSIDISDVLKYLGAPIATNRSSKMKFSENFLIKVKHQVNQLLLSPLTLAQSLDAIRKLIIPQLDFIFMNGVVSLSYVKKLDESIRALIQKRLKCPGIPIEVIHAHWKDGGMNIPRLEHRLELLQIRSFLGLLSSKDERVRKLIKFNMCDEAQKRNIVRSDVNSFIGFSKDQIGATNAMKTNTSFCRALQAASKLGLSVYVDDDEAFNADTQIVNFRLITDEDGNSNIINAKSFLPTMNKILHKHYCSDLATKEFRAHSFVTLKDSKLSNFFISNYKAPTSDNLVRFAFQARTNSLLTEEVSSKRNLNQNDKCKACGNQATGSLMHRLNKCTASMVRITARHNSIAKVICDGLMDMYGYSCPPLNENSNVFLPDADSLPDRSKNLKPDIWYIYEDPRTQKKSMMIIEITCPYGMLTDSPQGRISSLDLREKEKADKYKNLIEDIKNTWNIDATLHIIVVSSLGAITRNTVSTIKKLFVTKERGKLIAKRCVMAAIRGSWAIFYGKDLITSHRQNRAHNSVDINSSDHLTEEEGGDTLNDEN